MQISVPPEFESFVTSLVASRRFLSEHDVLSESLRLLQARELLVSEVQMGFDQIDGGKSVDGPSFLTELSNSLQSRIKD